LFLLVVLPLGNIRSQGTETATNYDLVHCILHFQWWTWCECFSGYLWHTGIPRSVSRWLVERNTELAAASARLLVCWWLNLASTTSLLSTLTSW